MLKTALLLAASDGLKPGELEDLQKAAKSAPSPWSGETGLIFAAALLVAAGLFFWAFFVRKRPKQHHGSLVMERAHKHPKEAHGASGRRRRRKRRPEHPGNWGRNPTLGETGGLPPARPDEPDAPPGSESPEPQR